MEEDEQALEATLAEGEAGASAGGAGGEEDKTNSTSKVSKFVSNIFGQSSSAASQKAQALRAEKQQETEEDTKNQFQWFRTWVVLLWMGANILLMFVCKVADPKGRTFLKVTLLIVTGINCCRFFGSLVFLIMHYFEQLSHFLCGSR